MRRSALDELVPQSLKVLKEHLESGKPDAWRPALRILDHAWGRPKETVEGQEDLVERSLDDLDLSELLELRQRLVSKHELGNGA